MSIINTSQCLVFLGVELFVLKNIDISQKILLNYIYLFDGLSLLDLGHFKS